MGNNLGIIETTHRNIHDIGTCGYKNLSTPGFCEKIDWMAAREREGLKMLSLWSDKDGHQGMIEYIPGEYCWRPVSATGYMFIHCLFAGLRKKYTGKGYATALIQMCIEDSMKKKKKRELLLSPGKDLLCRGARSSKKMDFRRWTMPPLILTSL